MSALTVTTPAAGSAPVQPGPERPQSFPLQPDGLLVAPSPSVSTVGLREGVEIFGGPELHGSVRVEMQVRVCLSFAEILGLLLHTPGLSLTYEELEDDNDVRESLQFALLDTDLSTMENNSERAMREYDDAMAGDGWPFVRRLAETVTRVFGVAA